MAIRAQPPEHSGEATGSRSTRPDATRGPASAVYGTVLAGSLIAIEGARDDVSVARLVAVVVVTQCVYWLAHTYAELVGDRISSGERQGRSEVAASLREDWPMVTVSFMPLAVIVLVWASGVSADTAVLAGLWSVAVSLAGWVLLAGRRAHLGAGELLLYVAVSAAVGVTLVLMRVIVH